MLAITVKRVMMQAPVYIRCFNSSEYFQSQSYRSLSDLFLQSCLHFSVDATQVGSGMRFYWLPDNDPGAAIGVRLAHGLHPGNCPAPLASWSSSDGMPLSSIM